MMKNILFLIFFFTSLSVVAQTLPVTPGVISRSTSPVEDRYIYARQHLGIPRYADTTQANIYNGIDTCGALIFTYNTNSLYFRQCSPKKWIQLVSNTPPNINDSLSYYWPTIPRYFSQFGPTVKRSIGSASEDGLYIVTGGVDQMVIRPPATGGLGRVSGSVYKVLMIDTIDRWVGWGDGWVGAGGGLNEIYAGYGLTKIDDSTLAFSTTLRDSLITLINLRLLKSDTAFMLANYIRVSRFNDSLNRHWNAIIGKQLQLNGTGFVRATGTTISYDNSTYLTSVDTSNISNFFSKVRSLFSGTYPIQYLNGNFNLDTGATGWKSIGFNDLRYTPISGSANYIRNGTTAQTANFNITGSGRVDSLFSAYYKAKIATDSMYYNGGLNIHTSAYLSGTTALSLRGGLEISGPNALNHVSDGGGYYGTFGVQAATGWQLTQQGVNILSAGSTQGFDFKKKGIFQDTLTITNMGITDSSGRAASTKFVKDIHTANQWYFNSRADSLEYAAMSEPLAGNNLVLNNLAIKSGSTYATFTHGYKNTLFNLDTFHFVTLTQLIDSLATVGGAGGGSTKAYAPNFIRNDSIYQRFNVLAYGADPTGATNSTVAFSNCIAAIIAHGNGVMYIPNGYYLGKIIIPEVAPPTLPVIKIEGETPPTPLFGTLGSYTFNNNAGAIIRDTSTSAGAVIQVAGSSLNNVYLEIENLDIRSYDNPFISGVDAYWAYGLKITNSTINTGVYNVLTSVPSHSTTGVITPAISNAGWTVLRDVVVSGYSIGFQINEHTDGDYLVAAGCGKGMDFKAANLASKFGRVNLLLCPYSLYVSGSHKFVIAEINVEHQASSWYTTVNDIRDTANLGVANVWYATPNTFSVNGASGIKYKAIGTDYGLNVVTAIDNESDANISIGDPASGAYALQLRRYDASRATIPGTYAINVNAVANDNTVEHSMLAGNGTVEGRLTTQYGATGITPYNVGSGVLLGTRTNHPMYFYTSGANKWSIDATGHLNPFVHNTYDIGSTSTYIKDLYAAGQIKTLSTGGVNSGLKIEATSTSNYANISFHNDQGLMGQILGSGSTYSGGAFLSNEISLYQGLSTGGIQLAGIGAAGYVRFTTGGNTTGNERMRIIANGNVGIGVTAPSKVFHTVGTVRHASLGTASADTTTYKPLGIDTNGDVFPMTSWPGGGGGGSGANTALSNLASVAINTALIPGGTGKDLGATSTPFRDLYIHGSGTYGTGSFKITGTPSANRTITIPDGSITLARIDNAQTFTGDQSMTGKLNVGSGAVSNYNLNLNDASASYFAMTTSGLGTGSTDGFAIGMEATGNYFINWENLPTFFYTNSAERARITGAGNWEFKNKFTKYNNIAPTDGKLLVGHTANGTFEFGNIASSNSSITVTDNPGGIDLAMNITESTYTPTLTNTTNIAASTAYTTHYIRIGDWVNVWGTVDIDATAATTITEMGMSLPESSTVGQIYDVAGTASFEDNTSVQIKGDVANGRAVWRFTPQSASNNKYSFHFSFKYVPA